MGSAKRPLTRKAEFAARDPTQAGFWDERYRAGFMPWDAHGVPAALVDFVERRRPGRRVLVPGCGSAYEAGWLDERGLDVTAIDIAASALERARLVLGAEVATRVLRQADFFDLDDAFDWIYERALLAALPPVRWPEYVESAQRLLAQGGLVAGFFFIDDAVTEPRERPWIPNGSLGRAPRGWEGMVVVEKVIATVTVLAQRGSCDRHRSLRQP